jgi:metal-sulfur cluster biosynthetic enzyme
VTTVDAVRDALREVVDPCSAGTGSNLDIVEMGLVKSIEISASHVDVEMRLTSPACFMVPYFIDEVEEHVGSLDGVESVDLETDDGFEWSRDMMTETARRRRQAVLDKQAALYRTVRDEDCDVADVDLDAIEIDPGEGPALDPPTNPSGSLSPD